MTKLPKSVAGYYKNQSEPHRKLLLEMRKLILEVIPDAKGSLHVPLGRPLLKSEVKKLIKARVALSSVSDRKRSPRT